MKRKLLNKCNALLTALLAFFGFGCNSCIPEYGAPVVCMYGVPSATMKLSGKVTDQQGQPLQNIQISVNTHPDDHYMAMVCTYTNEEGAYYSTTSVFPTDSVMVIARDTTLQHEADSVKLPLTYDTTDADSWYAGVASVDADFQLKETTQEHTDSTNLAQ